MATEMPIPQDYNRFVEPTEDEEQSDPSVFEIFDQESDVEMQPDGSAIIKLPDDKLKGPEDDPDFYENLADSLDVSTLSSLALKYIDLVEKDKDAQIGRAHV